MCCQGHEGRYSGSVSKATVGRSDPCSGSIAGRFPSTTKGAQWQTKTKLESAHETANKAQTVLDAADESLNAAEKAANKASKAKSKPALLLVVLVLAILGIHVAKRNQAS